MNTPSFDDILDEHRPRIVFGAAHAECSCGRWQHEQMEIAAREVLTPTPASPSNDTAPGYATSPALTSAPATS